MAASIEQSVLWSRGTGGYHTYRIPVLIVTNAGTVLAFCEGRRAGSGDTGDIDMLVRRSEDNGRSWSDQNIIWNDRGNVCGNPCAVVERETGSVFLLMTHNLGTDSESSIMGQTSEGGRTVWLTKSTDDGKSWSSPREITASTKRSDWTWYATGPSNGIQLTSRRMMIPCTHSPVGSGCFYSHVIYSDDRGETWRLGGATLEGNVNECCVAELGDGSILLNMRNYNPTEQTRQIAIILDGGMT